MTTPERPDKYEERAVAFVDLLGFRGTLRLFEEHPRFFNELVKFMTGMADIAARDSGGPPGGTQITAFSDSLCISANFPTERPGEATVNAAGICWLAAHASRALLRMGVLTRGGIAAGLLYHQGPIVLGRGLVHAYEIEQAAKYPRIVVADDLAVRINGLPPTARARFAEQRMPKGPLESDLLERDFDGCWILNAIPRIPQGDAWRTDGDTLRRFKTTARRLAAQLLEQLGYEPRNADVVSKLRWLITKLNPELAKAELPEIDIDDPVAAINLLGVD
jgi:hypothetical protein